MTQSCGCLISDITASRNYIHGHPKDATYWSWAHMIQRCENTKNKSYKDYGGRGITVCDRWKTFKNFLADMGDKPTGLLLDRIDNSRGYFKANCRWTTRHVQNNNRRNSIKYTHDGQTRSLNEWASILGIDRETIWARVKSGWSVSKALTTPLLKR